MHLSSKINNFMYDFNFAKSFPFWSTTLAPIIACVSLSSFVTTHYAICTFILDFLTTCFHLIKVAKCQPFYRYSLDFPVSRLFMIPCFQKNIPLQTAIYILPNVHLGDALHSHLVLPKSFHRYHSSIFLTDHTFECSIFKPETLVGLSPSESLTTT